VKTSADNETNSSEVIVIERRRHLWGVMLAGLSVGMLAIHFSVVQPMKQQLGSLRRQLLGVQSEMHLLVGQRDDIWKTNDLLTTLRTQQDELRSAKKAVVTVRQLREAIEQESKKTTTALASFGNLMEIQNELVAQRQENALAAKSLDRIAALHDRLIREHVSMRRASAAMNSLIALKHRAIVEADGAGAAESRLHQLANLKRQLLSESNGVGEAQKWLNGLLLLKDIINDESTNVDSAIAAVDEIHSFADELVRLDANTETVRANLGRLFILHHDLSSREIDFETAGHNLERLLEMQGKLTSRRGWRHDSEQLLRLLSLLRGGLNHHLNALGESPRHLFALAVSRSPVFQAAQLVGPLVLLAEWDRSQMRSKDHANRFQGTATERMSAKQNRFNGLSVPRTNAGPRSRKFDLLAPDPLEGF